MTRVPSTDVLRLEVADDPTGLVNLVANPSGELGGWGWVTPLAGTAMSGDPDGGGLTYNSNAVGAQNFQTEAMPIPALYYAAASWRLITSSKPASIGLWVQTFWQWVDAAGAVISSTPPGAWIDTTLAANRGHTMLYGPNQAPAGAVKVRLVFSVARASDGSAISAVPVSITFDQATVATAATAGELGTMRQNLVPDPDIEANPLTTWPASGPNVLVARDTAQHWNGAASAKLSSVVQSTRHNHVTNPNFEHGGFTGWQAEDSHTTISLDSGVPGASGTCLKIISTDGTREWVQAELTKARFIPLNPGQAIACRARFRFGNTGGNWGQTVVTMGARWTDAAGDYIDGTTIYPIKALVEQSGAQGTWLNITGTITTPARAHGIRLAFNFQDSNNLTVNQSAWIDKIMLEYGGTSSLSLPYIDGDVADAPPVLYDWTGTPGDSISTETTYLATTEAPGVVTSTQFPIRGGRQYTVSAALMHLAGTPDRIAFMRLKWYDSSHNPLTPDNTTQVFPAPISGAWTRQMVTITTPPAAAFATVAIYPASIGPSEQYYVDAVQVESGDDMGSFIIGQVTTGGLPYIPPITWVDILGSTHDVTVSRQSLNVGTLVASILDANLDPAREDLLHPGRAIRLVALSRYPLFGGVDNWVPLFTGAISQAEVTYDPQIPAPKRAKIQLTAVDALARLANIARSEGVGTVAALPYVLEGCGVPWDVNGSGNQVPSATVVAINENASALDQVAIVRDSALGFAWLDVRGTLHVYDDAGDYVGVVTTLDEAVYSDVDVSFNTAQAINEVNVIYTRFNPSTLDTEDVNYGPYTDAASVQEWGPLSADFRIQGIAETTAALQAYANAVLAANAQPIRRINSVLVPIKKTTDIDPAKGLLDLENLCTVVNSASDALDSLRIQSIEHHITTTAWTVRFGFGVDGQVASPTFTPAPGNTGGQTIGQLLRPVGEVTMFYGAKSAIPSGWLPLDGSTFSAASYPALATLLGSTTLPNMTDRFPVGAGTKALGTTGGNASVSLAAGQMPAHTHGAGTFSTSNTGGHQHDITKAAAAGNSGTTIAKGTTTVDSTGTGGMASAGGHVHDVTGATASAGSGNAIDITPPYRSLWFIIRAT